MKRNLARLLVAIARLFRLEAPHTERAYPHRHWTAWFHGDASDRPCAECGERLTNFSPLARHFPEVGLLDVCQVCAMYTTRGPQ